MVQFEIDTQALIHNIGVLRERAHVPIWAVVKFEGYGLGLEFAARTMLRCGLERFAVTEPGDIQRLRNCGVQGDILMLAPALSPEELNEVLEQGAIACVSSLEAAQALDRQAAAMGRRARAHIKLDTGMGRYGILPQQYDLLKGLYRDFPNIRFEGIFSHFSSAYGCRRLSVHQFNLFTDTLDRLRRDGIDYGMAHMENSPAFFRFGGMRLDAVRLGSAFVGRVGGLDDGLLQPVGQLVSAVEEVRDIPLGHNVGYGCRHRVLRPTRTAVIPMGCWDGVPQSMQKNADRLIIGGRPVHTLGQVGERHVVADVSGLDVSVNDRVTLRVNPLHVNQTVKKVLL